MVVSAEATGSMSSQSGSTDASFVFQEIRGEMLVLDIKRPAAMTSNSYRLFSEYAYSYRRLTFELEPMANKVSGVTFSPAAFAIPYPLVSVFQVPSACF